jgi:hypothetical protein
MVDELSRLSPEFAAMWRDMMSSPMARAPNTSSIRAQGCSRSNTRPSPSMAGRISAW